jgi:hypothetical protein
MLGPGPPAVAGVTGQPFERCPPRTTELQARASAEHRPSPFALLPGRKQIPGPIVIRRLRLPSSDQRPTPPPRPPALSDAGHGLRRRCTSGPGVSSARTSAGPIPGSASPSEAEQRSWGRGGRCWRFPQGVTVHRAAGADVAAVGRCPAWDERNRAGRSRRCVRPSRSRDLCGGFGGSRCSASGSLPKPWGSRPRRSGSLRPAHCSPALGFCGGYSGSPGFGSPLLISAGGVLSP